MTLKQLHAFYWAAQLGSFAIAADRLAISQSSLSKRIAELESVLGGELFDRSARRATLTEAGHSILESAKLMIDMETTLRERVSTNDGIYGTLRFGVGELGATTWFPKFMRSVVGEYPDLVIEPLVSQARAMELEVERGTLDCAVIAGSSSRPGLASQVLCGVVFSWMASPDLDVPQRRLTQDVLLRYPLIVPNALSGQSQAFQDWLTAANARPGRLIQCNSLNAIVEMTAAGTGISLLPHVYTNPIVRRRLLVRLKSDPRIPLLDYSFICRRDDTRPLITRIKALVIKQADFTQPSALWRS